MLSSLIIIGLAVLFAWLLLQAQKSQRRMNRTRRKIVNRIKDKNY